MSNLLVDQMGQEGGATEANGLVVALEGFAELHNKAIDQQLANLRKLRVHNGDHGGVDGSKGQTGSLSLHYASAEEPTPSNEVLAEQLGNNVFDVGDVDFVDQTIDRLLEGLPCHALEFLGRWVVADFSL